LRRTAPPLAFSLEATGNPPSALKVSYKFDFGHVIEPLPKIAQFLPNPEKNWGPKQKA